MKATAFEFRHRFWIILIIYFLGFAAPWDWVLPANLRPDAAGPNAHVWGVLAAEISKTGALSIGAAFNAVLVAGILLGLAGALLRTWGTAYLNAAVMRDTQIHAERVVADGPYRHVRNPLYIGSWIFNLMIALLMPASGAIFTVVALGIFFLQLILAEEASLATEQGASFAAYCAAVPRLLPALTPRVPGAGAQSQWGQALLAEIMLWGTLASFAVLGWRYNALLLDQCVLVWLGASMVVRGFAKKPD